MLERPYYDAIRDLPRPTAEQTESFVHFVANAHSWYKHLPSWPPGAPFVFFLDPNAGRGLRLTSSGQAFFVDRTSEDTPFHYTWMTTAEYRKRFGYWSYHHDRPSKVLLASSLGTGDGGMILDADSEDLPIPADFAQAATCLLTGFMHDIFNFPTMRFSREQVDFKKFVAHAKMNTLDPEVQRYKPLLSLVEWFDENKTLEKGEVLRANISKVLEHFHPDERILQREKIRRTLFRILDWLRDKG